MDRPVVTLQEWREQHGVNRQRALQWASEGRIPGAYRSPDREGGIWLVPANAPRPAAEKRGPKPRDAAP